jgi:2-polyprenyl-6-hydroxyphenyl methylase/3-demethylubiquinone-9 3-methyltransferase
VLSTPNWLWQLPVRLASRLKLRPYDGLENFMSPGALRRAVTQGGLSLARHKGIHLLPFQFAFLWPALRGLDRFGGALLPLMINQCIHATKGRS